MGEARPGGSAQGRRARTQPHRAAHPVVEDAGAFLEGVETTRAGRYSTVRVLVDLPDGPGDLDLDALTTVSRAVSAAVDEADPVRGQYTLEVSTPGAERELSTPRHFRRAVGRDVELMVKDDGVDAVLTGTVTAADEDSVTLQADGRERVLALDDVRQARMVVIF